MLRGGGLFFPPSACEKKIQIYPKYCSGQIHFLHLSVQDFFIKRGQRKKTPATPHPPKKKEKKEE